MRRGGLIPAHAGKTALAASPSGSWRAHPRSRGENGHRLPRPRVLPGSSPLTRGKLKQGLQHGAPKGLIPAHAGKTRVVSVVVPGLGAHPRSRGENAALSTSCTSVVGSSPLTRGKRRTRLEARGCRGLIPAHAGKTRASPQPASQRRAHPRSRGENVDGERETAEEWGSSPLTRGKRRIAPSFPRPSGLIPAHAGKTWITPSLGLALWAHPRSRGENL